MTCDCFKIYSSFLTWSTTLSMFGIFVFDNWSLKIMLLSLSFVLHLAFLFFCEQLYVIWLGLVLFLWQGPTNPCTSGGFSSSISLLDNSSQSIHENLKLGFGKLTCFHQTNHPTYNSRNGISPRQQIIPLTIGTNILSLPPVINILVNLMFLGNLPE